MQHTTATEKTTAEAEASRGAQQMAVRGAAQAPVEGATGQARNLAAQWLDLATVERGQHGHSAPAWLGLALGGVSL